MVSFFSFIDFNYFEALENNSAMDGNCAWNGQEEVDLTITHRVITAQIKFVDLCG